MIAQVFQEAALENDEILAGEIDDFGTPGENYAPGEVIVCVKGGSEALLKSDIFNGISNRAYSNAANGMQSPDSFDDVHSSADDIEGLSALFAATTITIEEKLMSLDMDEALVESIATEDTHEYAKAVYDNNDSLENPVADVDAFGKNQANYESTECSCRDCFFCTQVQ